MELCSPISTLESVEMGRNGHFLSCHFLALVISGFRALAPTKSGEHPLFSRVFNHLHTKEGPGLEKCAGPVFFIYGIGLDSASTCCDVPSQIFLSI